jgi:hypoxanthine phosphoribosyltransferase|tara:strand:- start:368 stop:826 length:459 start_codon:yes stop_codon:yes gene_type:complete
VSEKLWYNEEELRRDVSSLCRNIVLDKFDPQVIVGLSRGGLVPGVMMSHWFQKPFKPVQAALRDFQEWENYLPRKTDERVLIVDDICDSGETFEKISEYIHKNNSKCDVRFASLIWNNEVDFEPHYYSQEMAKDSQNIWVVFNWEQWWNIPV